MSDTSYVTLTFITAVWFFDWPSVGCVPYGEIHTTPFSQAVHCLSSREAWSVNNTGEDLERDLGWQCGDLNSGSTLATGRDW